jgi:drug/metabolite transporter (DMT)-like permease
MTQTLSAPRQAAPVPTRAYLALLAGIIAVSLAAIFIRLALAEGVPALVIAAARLIVATALLTPITLRRYGDVLRRVSRPELLLLLISGVFLAIHFAAWVSALQYANVLISGVLVTTTPIWAGLLEVVFLKTRLNRLIVLGMLVALLGGVIIALSGGEAPSASESPSAATEIAQAAPDNTLLGGGLALLGAMTVSVYMVIGRKLRATLPLLPYIWMVYGCAALILIVVALAGGLSFTGYSAEGYLWMLAVGLIPQLIGHSSLNYALGYLPATYISIATQTEPLASALMALVIFREQPTAMQIIGSAVILVGVALTTLRPPTQAAAAPPVPDPEAESVGQSTV